MDITRALNRFSLSEASCFDPNEERRLRDIISARGEGLFESRIRELADICEKSAVATAASLRSNTGHSHPVVDRGTGTPI